MQASDPCNRSPACTTGPDGAQVNARQTAVHIAAGNGSRIACPATAGWTQSDDPTGMLRAARGIAFPGPSCDNDD